MIISLDVVALALTTYGLGLAIVPFIIEDFVIVSGAEAAFPWLAAGAFASVTGGIETYETGGSAQDIAVAGGTNLAGLAASRLPIVGVIADVIQLLYDVHEATS